MDKRSIQSSRTYEHNYSIQMFFFVLLFYYSSLKIFPEGIPSGLVFRTALMGISKNSRMNKNRTFAAAKHGLNGLIRILSVKISPISVISRRDGFAHVFH